jgi:hypothetical protein
MEPALRPGAVTDQLPVVNRTALLLPMALLAACTPEPIAWAPEPDRRAIEASKADSALAAAIGGAFGETPQVDQAPDSLLRAMVDDSSPCLELVRVSRPADRPRALVWWSARPDGRAQLRQRASTDTGWRATIPVDTVVARDSTGCRRAAPSVTVDRQTRWVHIAYSMVAPEGPGLFYAHQMDPRVPFEPPRVIVYGDGQPASSVASDGQIVAIGFENPNDRPTIAVALSRTGGHLWEPPVRVSNSSVPALRPRIAVGGDSIALGWIEPAAVGRPVTIVIRRGRVKS